MADDLTALSDREIAALHAGYGYGGHEAVDHELWRRFPHVAGWHAAAAYLRAQHLAEYRALQDSADVMDLGPDPSQAPGYACLMTQYRRTVDGIANGATR